MSKDCHTIGTPNTAGAPVVSTRQNNVYCNSQLVAVNGSPVAAHGPAVHGSPVTANGSPTVFVKNIPVNRKGDPDNCGHPRATGSPNVFVGP